MINAEAMNSVTDEKQRRRLTKDVMAGIPVLVAQSMMAPAIADRLGCKLGTLKVRCSQAKISLRRPGAGLGRGRGRAIATRLSDTALDRFRKRAAAIGAAKPSWPAIYLKSSRKTTSTMPSSTRQKMLRELGASQLNEFENFIRRIVGPKTGASRTFCQMQEVVRDVQAERADEFGDWRARVLCCVGFFTLLLVVAVAAGWLS